MVDVLGHFGMALLFAVPAWVVWDGRASMLTVGLVLVTAMLPDVDLLLRNYVPITHHGITHTVVFVVAVSLVAGAIVEYGLGDWIERTWLQAEGRTLSTWTLFVLVAGAFMLGAFSHLFADMLSAPDIAAPVEPFWPFFDKAWSVDVIYYNSPWWNSGLVAVALALHANLAYLDFQVDHPYRITERT